MNLNYFASCITLCVLFHIAASNFFSCHSSRGLYYGLNKHLGLCRQSAYIPTLRKLRKMGGTVDGSRLVLLLKAYCRHKDDADGCVKDFIYMSPCRRDQERLYQESIVQSNSICEDDIKEILLTKLATLPLMEISPFDPCYLEAARAARICKRRYIRFNMSNRKTIAQQIMASLPCTYERLRTKCSPDSKAKFYAVLQYDSLILPPALGVNVTETLLKVL